MEQNTANVPAGHERTGMPQPVTLHHPIPRRPSDRHAILDIPVFTRRSTMPELAFEQADEQEDEQADEEVRHVDFQDED